MIHTSVLPAVWLRRHRHSAVGTTQHNTITITIEMCVCFDECVASWFINSLNANWGCVRWPCALSTSTRSKVCVCLELYCREQNNTQNNIKINFRLMSTSSFKWKTSCLFNWIHWLYERFQMHWLELFERFVFHALLLLLFLITGWMVSTYRFVYFLNCFCAFGAFMYVIEHSRFEKKIDWTICRNRIEPFMLWNCHTAHKLVNQLLQ